jgi:PAS domain S-box-containing protein
MDASDESRHDDLHAERRLRLLIGSVRDYAIFMLDPQGRIETWNAGAEAIKGYRADEVIGHTIDQFYTPEDRAAGKPQALLRIARETGRVEDEGWRVRKDGTRFWCDVVITAAHGPDGSLLGYAKVTRDLTDRRAAEEELRQSEQRFRLLVESVKDHAIFMLDPGGRVATWNVGAQRIKGYRGDEIIGRHFSQFYPPEVPRARIEAELTTALAEGRWSEEGWRVRKDGSYFWANVVITPVFDSAGRHVGFAKVTRDLTEQRQAEQERLHLAQADEAIRLRDEFLSIASHELRTPLTALQLQLEAIRRRPDLLDERSIQRLDRATRSGDRLAQLVDALLDVSRIATGKLTMRPEEVDLAEIVRETVERMQESANKASCLLGLRSDARMVGIFDALRMGQVLTNLIGNALKYGSGAPIEVTLAARDGVAELTVADGGPGIGSKDLARIFERFERASSIRNYGGMGLGLYVARQIVEAHGGTIDAHNRPTGGACFTVRVPIRQAGEAAAARGT